MTDHAQDTPLVAIVADLRLIADQARWAHGLAYEPAGRGIDPEPGRALPPPTADEINNPDHVSGPTYDLGVGNHRARHAWHQAVHTIAHVDRLLAIIAARTGLHRQRALRPLHPAVTPHTLVCAALDAEWRAEHISDDAARIHRRELDHARLLLDRCARTFSAALDHGPTAGIAHREDTQPHRGVPPDLRCIICGWRKQRKKDGKRCPTCAKYLARTGRERPQHLDGINPHDAQAKRLRRGEGWGVA